jgi:hypothetical protein
MSSNESAHNYWTEKVGVKTTMSSHYSTCHIFPSVHSLLIFLNDMFNTWYSRQPKLFVKQSGVAKRRVSIVQCCNSDNFRVQGWKVNFLLELRVQTRPFSPIIIKCHDNYRWSRLHCQEQWSIWIIKPGLPQVIIIIQSTPKLCITVSSYLP